MKFYLRTWKRGFIEIVGEILESLSKNPLKKSHISSSCNLDTRAVSKYLNLMIELKLVEKSKDKIHYKITLKGIRFLDEYDLLTKFLENDLENDQSQKESHLRKAQINR